MKVKKRKVELNKGPRKLFFVVAFAISVISAMIFSGVGASLQGAELHSIELEIAEVEAVSRRLGDEIVMKTSLTEVSNAAAELGFSKPESVIYWNGEIPVLGYAR